MIILNENNGAVVEIPRREGFECRDNIRVVDLPPFLYNSDRLIVSQTKSFESSQAVVMASFLRSSLINPAWIPKVSGGEPRVKFTSNPIRSIRNSEIYSSRASITIAVPSLTLCNQNGSR